MSDTSRLLKELSRRDELAKELLDELFDKQKNFILDPARFKTAKCTRRAGKSWTAGADLIRDMILYPGCNVLFVATTLKQAKRILLKDIVKVIARRYRIPLKPNMTEGFVAHPNGSVLYCMGADADKSESDKILGLKFRKVYIDEGASYKQDLRHIVYSSIVPTLADQNGIFCMIGTTGNNTTNMFFDITGRTEGDPLHIPGFSSHEWTYKDNPHTCKQVAALIEDLKSKNPFVDQTAWFRQMYLNEWVIEDDKLVYKFKDDRNTAPFLPIEHIYKFGLVVDLGYNDDTAFVVPAWSSTDPNMYFVSCYKKKGMDVTDVANTIKVLEAQYKFVNYFIDGANKQAVMELRNRYKIPFQPTDKQGKSDIIEIMNADMTMGRIKALPGAYDIVDEWRKLTWDPKSNVRKENPRQPNNAADAALYAWRMCFHYNHKMPEPIIQEFSEKWMDEYANKLERKLKGDKKQPWFIRDWRSGSRLDKIY